MKFSLTVGELADRVELYSRTETTDAYGQKALTWTLVATVWAKRVPMRAEERFEAAQMQTDVMERFFIRARSDVANTWRLVWTTGSGTPAYDITGVTLMPGRAFTEVLARRAVKDGR